MIHETLGVLLGIALLGLIGIGPALHLVPTQANHFRYTLAIAPVLGFVLVEIIGLPLVRYIAPVQVWAIPVTILLIALSGVLGWAWWRLHKTERPFGLDANSILVPAIVFFACFLVLVSPVLTMGIQYTIFRSNSSDAFTYISLGESMRSVPWPVLVNGIQFSSENYPALERLAAVSPGALLTARMVGLPIQLNNMVTLAWFSQVTGLPVYLAYYPYHVVAFLNAFLLGLAWGAMLQLNRIKYAAAAVIALGFWARYVFETDASFEIITIPLMLLTTFAWAQLEQHAPTKLLSPARILFALALTALVCNYLVFPGLVIIAFAIFYIVAVLRRQSTVRTVAYHMATAGVVLLILGVTGQLDIQLLSLAYIIGAIELQRAFEPTVWNMWRANGISAVWGMGTETLFGPQRALIRLPLAVLSNLFALGLSALLVMAAWIAFFRTRRISEQILFSVLVAGLVMVAISLVGDNLRASGKAFSYVYPYVVLGAAVASGSLVSVAPRLERIAFAGVMLWLVVQLGLGILLPYTDIFTRVFNYSRRTEAYDLTPITRALETNPPNLLLVAVPRTKGWEFAYYTSLVLGRFPAYFSSGLIMDNNVRYQNFWKTAPATAPDYAVVLKTADIMDMGQIGEPLAETRDLILYRLDRSAAGVLKAQEDALHAADLTLPVFEPGMPLRFGVRKELIQTNLMFVRQIYDPFQ